MKEAIPSTTRFYSHPAHRQDRWVIAEVLRGKRNGFFVDAGAGPDGIASSNTYALETQFGWTGLCVEPQPNWFENVSKNRKCRVVDMCLTDVERTVEFTVNHLKPGTSGLVDQMGEASRENDYKPNEHYEILKLNGIPLAALLHEHNAPKIIDYLSMDIEGAEYLVLKDFPFHEYRFRCMTIERNSKDFLRLRRLLFRQGYRLAHNYCIDDFFYHPSVDYRPSLSTRLQTAARKAAQGVYWREPVLTARRWRRRLRNR